MSAGRDSAVEEGADELEAAARLPAPSAPVGWSALALRDAVASGELGAVEVVGLHLERLGEVEPWLNAAACVRGEAALADAEALERRLAAGEAPGPLCGVPVSVKDVIATARTETACGSRALAGHVPESDAVAVARLRAAGAIVVAKANCPEFAFGVTCESPLHGVTRSPWGDHSPGGSSGGDAALVAAEATAIGIGTDYGGSVRWPAACCGVLALRPGVGSVDGTGQLPERGGRIDGRAGAALGPDGLQRRRQVIGPLARSVADLRAVHAVLAGRAVSDEALEDVTVGVVGELDDVSVDAEVGKSLAAAAFALADAGIAVLEAPRALDGLHAAYDAVRAIDPLADLRAALGGREVLAGATVREILAAAPQAPADPARAARVEGELERCCAAVLHRLREIPVLLAPVAPVAACDLQGRAVVAGKVLGGFALMAHCRAVSALGVPALSVPVAEDRHGLPVSVQVIARPGGEGLALAVGGLLERGLGGRRPPQWLESRPTAVAGGNR